MIAANVGLFNYEISYSIDPSDLNEGCIAYDGGRFSYFSEGNAEFMGGCSGLHSLCHDHEWSCLFNQLVGGDFCSFFCSFIFACKLLWIAGVLQVCTLMVLGGSDFW